MRFSQRIGERPVHEALQIQSMDSDLQNSIWNLLHDVYFCKLAYYFSSSPSLTTTMVKNLWRDFFKAQLDKLPRKGSDVLISLKEWFFEAEWFDVYDLLEFIVQLDPAIEDEANNVLKREMSGYRFIERTLVPITNETELAEIDDAIQKSSSSPLVGVNEHIHAALTKLADRKNPDYRNSIKESISAVEAIAGIISGSSSSTLGSALKVIETKVGLHPALKRGFSAIYGYTSNEDGIRHALMESSQCDFEDAKYMLVACSAFVNYLISKAEKAELRLNTAKT